MLVSAVALAALLAGAVAASGVSAERASHALALSSPQHSSPRRDQVFTIPSATPLTSRPAAPSTTPAAPVEPKPPALPIPLAQRLAGAAQYGERHGLRVGIAVSDLATGAITTAGEAGTFGTGSVVKVIVATKMLLVGAMTGADADEAYEMVIGSNDDDCNVLWEKYGERDIVGWVGRHYGITIGYPNLRPGFWGNTLVTPRGLAAFYLAVSRDPVVWPWLHNAMSAAKRIADDGTDQYFGIPDAGGGHVVKQGWATASSGDGYQPDATVNTTGIVTVGSHRYAVVVLTEGHGNDSQADPRGFVHSQGQVVTGIAGAVLAALRTSAT